MHINSVPILVGIVLLSSLPHTVGHASIKEDTEDTCKATISCMEPVSTSELSASRKCASQKEAAWVAYDYHCMARACLRAAHYESSYEAFLSTPTRKSGPLATTDWYYAGLEADGSAFSLMSRVY